MKDETPTLVKQKQWFSQTEVGIYEHKRRMWNEEGVVMFPPLTHHHMPDKAQRIINHPAASVVREL